MASVGVKLDEHKGFGPGFDFLRITLAFGVVGWHSLVVTRQAPWIMATPLWITDYGILPMFFGLSGFLVAGSGLRLRLWDFVLNRGLRIVPALAVEILFSALLLGPIFTSLTLQAYFTHPEFWKYFSNIVGIIHFNLPGVFQTNPFHQVNRSLWTIPYEIGCYVVISLLIGFRLLSKVWVVAALTAALLLAACGVYALGLSEHAPRAIRRLYQFAFLSQGATLLPAFLMGVLGYLLRYRIPYDWRLFAGCAALVIVAAAVGSHAWKRVPYFHLVAMPALIYAMIWLGATRLPRLPLFHRGDYSYGIYLYHMPFQQALLALFPWMAVQWGLHLGLTAILITLVSMASWHGIEKPILSLRKRFSFATRMRDQEEKAAAALKAAKPASPSIEQPSPPLRTEPAP